MCLCFFALCRSLLKLRDFYFFLLCLVLFHFHLFSFSDVYFLNVCVSFSVSLCGCFYEGDFVSFLISFVWFCLFYFFSIPLFRLCLMLTMKDRENVSVCVFVFVWFVYLLILLIYFYLVFFFLAICNEF